MSEAKGKFSDDIVAYVDDRMEAYLSDLLDEVGIVECTDRVYYEYMVAIRTQMKERCDSDLNEANKFFDNVNG